MRHLVQEWDDNEPVDAQVERVVGWNILAKKSRSRVKQTLTRAFIPRFVKGDPPNAWKMVRPLEDRNLPVEIILPVYYWITAKAEPLIYDFVTEALIPKYQAGLKEITVEESLQWLSEKLSQQQISWSDSVRKKVARGLLASLRDFGSLEGKAKKKIASKMPAIGAFAFIAFILAKTGAGKRMLLAHVVDSLLSI